MDMQKDIPTSEEHVNTRSVPSPRSKSSIRIRYEAEVEILRRKIGGLEDVREQLGLSQRKICQLLLVDPSAWTRWTRADGKAPPHIYRALQWYLALNDKYPALDVSFWLSAAPRSQESQLQDAAWKSTSAELESLKRELGEWREQFQVQTHAREIHGPSFRTGVFLGFSLGILAGGGLTYLFASL